MRAASLLTCAAATGLLAGCAAPILKFTKEGASQETFMQDRYECLTTAKIDKTFLYGSSHDGWATSQLGANRSAFMSCMKGKGYTADSSGNLMAPKGAEVELSD